MASYLEWSTAILDHFTTGLKEGDPVYLTVDDDSLAYIGHHYLNLRAEDSRRDFVTAVRDRCTQLLGGARRVKLDLARGISGDGIPNCVGFLAAMVLAAYDMQADGAEQITGANYFRRFNELLDLTSGPQSRPLGFAPGDEEGLWRTLNAWVALSGYKPTAKGGEGAHAYIDYPIEQSLLRRDDRDYLVQRMRRDLIAPRDRMFDEAQFSSWILRQKVTRRHLQAGLGNSDPDRVGAFVDAAFRIYQAIDWRAGNEATNDRGRLRLTAGLIRSVSLRGVAVYRVFARRPARWKSDGIAVIANGQSIPLVPFKADVFSPLWQTDPFPLEPIELEVQGDSSIESLIFPRRDFWILTPDPDDPYGQIGTWEKYPSLLGRKFWILVRGGDGGEISQELDKYRREGLLDWDSCNQSSQGEWMEYRGCMILSRAWDCVVPAPGTEALFDALCPSVFATAALSGGLRVPGGQGWLHGFPPRLTIYGFEQCFQVTITREGAGDIAKFEIRQQVARSLDECVEAGTYEITVTWQDRQVAWRPLRVLPWEQIEVAKTANEVGSRIGDISIKGAFIEAPATKRT